MTNINNLFDELLEKIFLDLPVLSDRLRCKEVCQRWLKLLMTSSKFRNDRHIYITNINLDPARSPARIFTYKSYPYQSLTINSSDRFDASYLVGFRRLLAFFGCSATNVKVSIVDYSYFLNNLDEFSILMPSVTSLDLFVKNSCQDNVEKLAAIIKELFPNVQFLKFSHLIKVETLKKLTHDGIKVEIQSIPRLKPSSPYLKIKNLTFYKVSPYFGKLDEEDYYLPPCKSIEIYEEGDFAEFDYREWDKYEYRLNGFVKSIAEHSFIEEIEFTGYFLPEHVWAQITKLQIYISASIELKKILEFLTNLKWLKICFNTDCFFGHEVIILPNLEYFAIFDYDEACNQCFNTMIQSVQNVKRFELDTWMHNYPKRYFPPMFNDLPQLESLTITTEDAILAEIIKDLTKPLPYIRKLKVESKFDCVPEDFVKLSKILPNLRTLQLNFVNEEQFGPIEELIIVISKSFKKLISLKLNGSLSKTESTRFAVAHAMRRGKSLRELTISNVNNSMQ